MLSPYRVSFRLLVKKGESLITPQIPTSMAKIKQLLTQETEPGKELL
jgi:hypothetical protein